MLKQKLEQDLKKAIKDLGFETTDVVCSISKNPKFGDYSSSIALQLAKQKIANSYQSTAEIANEISKKLSDLSYLSDIKIENGFLNFFIKPEFIAAELQEILEKGEDFGKNNLGQGEKIEVEFISANPTGPLTLANGRGGALGDTLSNVLNWSGYQVNKQYYVNDSGNQIRLLGESVLAVVGRADRKEEHYQGDYINDLAEKFKDQINLPALELGQKLADYLLEEEIKPAIEKLGIKFDEFYSERSIYERDLISKTVETLKEKGLAYEKDGALWFKATSFGDEKDRVLMTSEESRGKVGPTYFLADIAHHIEDLEKGYIKRINILGADHHGYGARMKGVMEALGFKDKTEIIFIQFVRLFKEGKEVRMSKRAGTYVTINDLLEEVGKDVVRFFFLMYAPSSHIDFNIDIAREKSEKNPVFYVQYAHARMANILAKLKGEAAPGQALRSLQQEEELNLIKHLAYFPDLVENIAQMYQVQSLTTYVITLADLFHKFYEKCQVLNAETEELKLARLALVRAGKQVLGNTLKLMGISAPERM